MLASIVDKSYRVALFLRAIDPDGTNCTIRSTSGRSPARHRLRCAGIPSCERAAFDRTCDEVTARRTGARCAATHRTVAIRLTIDETLTGSSATACSTFAFFRLSRRILAKVFLKSVLKLAVYRNEGSRMDFIWSHAISSTVQAAIRRQVRDARWKRTCAHDDRARLTTLPASLLAVSAVTHICGRSTASRLCKSQSLLARSLDDRTRQRMLATLVGTCRKTQNFGFIERRYAIAFKKTRRPRVSIPILSTISVSTRRSVSRASASRNKMPLVAARPLAT